MKVQEIETLKHMLTTKKKIIEDADIPKGLKGAAITKEKAKREGYINCLNDIQAILNKVSE